MFEHEDVLSSLNDTAPAKTKLASLHAVVRQHVPEISRIAIALYDNGTDELKTFINSSDKPSALANYHTRLADAHSLLEIVQKGKPRIINDLDVFADSDRTHSQKIREAGYLASYTVPMVIDNRLLGFVFFNSDKKNVFNELVLSQLDMVAHMVALLIYNERSNIRTLLATVKSALDLTHSRDPETGTHLERMSRYSRIIASELSQQFGLSDEFIEHIYLFSPLHDLGKIKVPDNILLKPARLTEDEFAVMKRHAADGKQLIDALLDNYGLNGLSHVDMLKNIALYHHEALDGSGYPEGLVGEQIPLEARIVTVADVFDALTSTRPYKRAWTNQEAFAKLAELSNTKLDPDCVAALRRREADIEHIQSKYQENSYV